MDIFSFGEEKTRPYSGSSRLNNRGGVNFIPASTKTAPAASSSNPSVSSGALKLNVNEIPQPQSEKTEEENLTGEDNELEDRTEETVLDFDNFTRKKRSQKKTESPLLKDSELTFNVREVKYLDLNIPKYNFLFWIEVIQILWIITITIIGIMILTNSIVINNYWYLIIGTIITGVLCALQVFGYIIHQNSYPNLSRDNYFNDILTNVVTTLIAQVFAWLGLGIWIRDFAICCDISKCQPNIADPNNFDRFYLSYLILTTLPFLTMIWVYPRSICAHLNPTRVYDTLKKQ